MSAQSWNAHAGRCSLQPSPVRLSLDETLECSSPSPTVDASPDFQTYMDGNYRLMHRAGAGRATTHAAPLNQLFVADDKVDGYCQSRAKPSGEPPPNDCNDFRADERLGRTKAQYDMTGDTQSCCLLCLSVISHGKL